MALAAYSFTVTGQRGPAREPVIGFDGNTSSYFQIHQAASATGRFTVVGMELGLSGAQSWTNTGFLAGSNEFLLYKVRRVPQTNSLDEDQDGMPDVYELHRSFLDPLNPADAQQDQDGDGLFNLGEFQYGSDPTNRDTDRDWVLDGYEVVKGTHPTNPASAPTLEFRVNADAYYVTNTGLRVDFGPHVADTVVISETPDMANSVTVALTGIFTYALADASNGWTPLYARLRRASDGAESELIEQMFILDTLAPQISGVVPTNGTVTALEAVRVEGCAADDVGPVQVLVNGEWADGVITGCFHRGQVGLTNGLNWIEVTARDGAGHTTAQTVAVTRTTSGSNAPPAIAGNSFPQTFWDGIYSNWYSSLAYFNDIPQWDTVDGWWLYRDHWVAASNQVTEVVKSSVRTCTYVPSPNCNTENATDTSTWPQSTPITFAWFGEEAVWRNQTSPFVPQPEWNRETFGYRDVVTFLPSNQSQNVIIKFNGMGYRRAPGEPGYANLITFRGSTGFIYQGQVAFNATIRPGVEFRISASDFTWPDDSYIGTRSDRRFIYDGRTKTKAHLLWFDSVQIIPQ
ncbi:MAG: hypothetical protein V1873_04440 [Verrucomicrobiota bacterium]